jgi:nitric oxide dioxygenase
MSLTDEDKQLVTTSFIKVSPIAEKAAELFYGRLFEIAPDSKELLKETDMKEQGRKLMQTIATAVCALYRLEQVVPEIKNLGRRHIAYGVKKEQYAIVGEALLWTLEKGLGDDFTPEVKAAWTKVYTVLADTATTAYDDKEAKAQTETNE